MKNRKRRFQIESDEEHYWPSFADMMAMIVLVMLFIAIIAFVQMIYDAYDQTVMKEELAKVADVKKHISDLIEQQLEENVGKDKIVRGPNNTISVEGDILFDTGSAEVSPEGKKVLNELADVFASLVEEEDISQYLYIILIEGHTDKVPYDNWTLSADRSVAVVKELMKANPTLATPEYAKYLAATGYSEYKPVVAEETEEAFKKNRRISFQIILDDEKWQGRLKDIMKY
ncbi:OmpA family protein [Pseudalkalibacillus hwajinpoensis]|uniref:OmpA/MotB family protein n=1 Tax=Guptibacillus hwajinpoensis TaxID=208199 RepID=UPI00325B645C